MYEIGQQVLCGIYGVCRIISVESMRFGKERAKYYVLEPAAQPGTRFYVPVANETAVAKLRPLLTKEELLELLHHDGVRNAPYRHKNEQLAAGRKFHQSDENALADAQKLLNAEFAEVFGLNPKDVPAFILKELENTH